MELYRSTNSPVATKVYFLSSVTDFSELAHIHTTESEMDLNYQQIRLRFSHKSLLIE